MAKGKRCDHQSFLRTDVVKSCTERAVFLAVYPNVVLRLCRAHADMHEREGVAERDRVFLWHAGALLGLLPCDDRDNWTAIKALRVRAALTEGL